MRTQQDARLDRRDLPTQLFLLRFLVAAFGFFRKVIEALFHAFQIGQNQLQLDDIGVA